MGLISVQIELSNPKNRTLRPITVRALADTEELHLCIPEHVAIQLQFEELYKREITTADGGTHLCSYVGPVEPKERCSNKAISVGGHDGPPWLVVA